MPIDVVCGDCDKQHRVKDELAGKKIRCKACQGVIAIPAVDDDDPFGDLDLKNAGQAIPKRRPRAVEEDEDDDTDDSPSVRRSRPLKSKTGAKRRTRGSGIPVTATIAIACQCLLLLFGILNVLVALGETPDGNIGAGAKANHTGRLAGTFFRVAISWAILSGLLKRRQNARQWSRGLAIVAAFFTALASVGLFVVGDKSIEAVIMICLCAVYMTIATCLSTQSADEWFVE